MSPGNVKNKRFNRFEDDRGHHYVHEFPETPVGDTEHDGLVKCKLVHGRGFSAVVPDQLYIRNEDEWAWIQPLFFTACNLSRTDDFTQCQFGVDVSHGQRLLVRLFSSDRKSRLNDGSEVFRCSIHGPSDLVDYATGSAHIKDSISLDLFHHTTDDARAQILESCHLRPSRWNIQGTKRLANVGYVYFTSLDRIAADQDLHQIAMASNGKICLLRDDGRPDVPGDVLAMDVYRESTLNRRASVPLSVPAQNLAPQHLLRHDQAGAPVFYEVVGPFIHRVGTLPDEVVPIAGGAAQSPRSGVRRFDYIVIGDARTLDGLAAPYDEENTAHLLKIERPPPDMTILEFWFSFSNQDLFSGKLTELQEFEASE